MSPWWCLQHVVVCCSKETGSWLSSHASVEYKKADRAKNGIGYAIPRANADLCASLPRCFKQIFKGREAMFWKEGHFDFIHGQFKSLQQMYNAGRGASSTVVKSQVSKRSYYQKTGCHNQHFMKHHHCSMGTHHLYTHLPV